MQRDVPAFPDLPIRPSVARALLIFLGDKAWISSRERLRREWLRRPPVYPTGEQAISWSLDRIDYASSKTNAEIKGRNRGSTTCTISLSAVSGTPRARAARENAATRVIARSTIIFDIRKPFSFSRIFFSGSHTNVINATRHPRNPRKDVKRNYGARRSVEGNVDTCTSTIYLSVAVNRRTERYFLANTRARISRLSIVYSRRPNLRENTGLRCTSPNILCSRDADL